MHSLCCSDTIEARGHVPRSQSSGRSGGNSCHGGQAGPPHWCSFPRCQKHYLHPQPDSADDGWVQQPVKILSTAREAWPSERQRQPLHPPAGAAAGPDAQATAASGSHPTLIGAADPYEIRPLTLRSTPSAAGGFDKSCAAVTAVWSDLCAATVLLRDFHRKRTLQWPFHIPVRPRRLQQSVSLRRSLAGQRGDHFHNRDHHGVQSRSVADDVSAVSELGEQLNETAGFGRWERITASPGQGLPSLQTSVLQTQRTGWHGHKRVLIQLTSDPALSPKPIGPSPVPRLPFPTGFRGSAKGAGLATSGACSPVRHAGRSHSSRLVE